MSKNEEIIEEPDEVDEVEDVATNSIEKKKRTQTAAQKESTSRNLAKGREVAQLKFKLKKETEAILLAEKMAQQKKQLDKKLTAKAKIMSLDLEYQEFLNSRETKKKKKMIVEEESSEEEEVIVVRKKKPITQIEKYRESEYEPEPAPPAPPAFRLKRV